MLDAPREALAHPLPETPQPLWKMKRRIPHECVIRAEDPVLKPQRECGGNNVYRDAIPRFLAALARCVDRDGVQRRSRTNCPSPVRTLAISGLRVLGACCLQREKVGDERGMVKWDGGNVE